MVVMDLMVSTNTATTSTFALSSPTALVYSKVYRQLVGYSPQCVTLPTLFPRSTLNSKNRLRKTIVLSGKKSRNVEAMATGDTTADGETELPEIVKKAQAAWEKVDDKYAVTLLAVASLVALWGSTGLISAIDRLPLIPGILELIGIGYTGWFGYKNLVLKPDREALIEKIKEKYNDVIGSS